MVAALLEVVVMVMAAGRGAVRILGVARQGAGMGAIEVWLAEEMVLDVARPAVAMALAEGRPVVAMVLAMDPLAVATVTLMALDVARQQRVVAKAAIFQDAAKPAMVAANMLMAEVGGPEHRTLLQVEGKLDVYGSRCKTLTLYRMLSQVLKERQGSNMASNKELSRL
jgi:hypothetical protein